MTQVAVDTLKQYFGFDQFRPGQEEIVDAILTGQAVLAILPTGGGKSLCFQVPALALAGTTLVISPLISLMKDQVDHLQQRGIAADYLGSNLSQAEQTQRLDKLSRGDYKLFYVAPERLSQSQFIDICRRIRVPLLVIDEAHCISLWGQQFRPSYQQIPIFLQKIQTKQQKIAIAAFTATATDLVKKEIIAALQLSAVRIFAQGFLRQNLLLHNLTCPSIFAKNIYLFKLLKQHQGENLIIYCSTRKACEQLGALIKYYDFRQQYRCGIYHGGLEKSTREQMQNNFLKGQLNIMIATNAFGMGVDKSDIRAVIHYQLSAHLENYYQEAGRGGRDGQPATAYLLYYPGDLLIQEQMIARQQQLAPHPERAKVEQRKLRQLHHYATSSTCLEQIIRHYFAPNQLRSDKTRKTEITYSTCHNCYLCLDKSIELSEVERCIVHNLEAINRRYAASAHLGTTQVLLTLPQIELIAILQPRSAAELARLPGIGDDIIAFYASQGFSAAISRDC